MVELEGQRECTAAGATTRRWALVASALPAAAALVALGLAWPLVPNRFTFGWDAALRAISDVDAASGPLRFLVRLLGPEVWPTLRLAVLAPLLALGAPPLVTEAAVSIVTSAATFFLLGWMASRWAESAWDALLAVAIGVAALAANCALTVWAASPMLEAQAALATLAATFAWIRLREGAPEAPVWPVALLGNVLFHTKFQYGLLFAIAVLGTEAALLPSEARRRAGHALVAAARDWLRHWAAWVILVVAVIVGATGWIVERTGGGSFRIGPIPVTVHDASGPIFWAAFLAFYGVVYGLWRSRTALRESIPARLRGLWTWLVVPMGAWILVPFAWRLRMLLFTATTYDSAARLPGRIEALAFYPTAMWQEWYSPVARAAMLAGLAATAAAAWRLPAVRRRLLPIAVMVLFELFVLAVGARKNFQPRFITNLAPLLALAATLWLPALGLRLRLAAGLVLAGALAAVVIPAWRPEPLARTLAFGYGEQGVAEQCADVVRGAPLRRSTLVADLQPNWLKDCILQLHLEARRQGARVVERQKGRPIRGEVIRLLDHCDTAPLPGLRYEQRAGQVCLHIEE